jgi:glutathione-dependent peroxiredoxin
MISSARNLEGTRVPRVTFRTRALEQWKYVTSDELFDGRTVVLFALPGAYLFVDAGTHLPRYNELAGALKAGGVHEIVCVSVNDAFVMNRWKQDLHADNVTLLPDGNGEFTSGMGMLADRSSLGFGMRSWRYSMLVVDGVIEKMFVEAESLGDPFEVSDADTMLAYVRSKSAARESAAAPAFNRSGALEASRP